MRKGTRLVEDEGCAPHVAVDLQQADVLTAQPFGKGTQDHFLGQPVGEIEELGAKTQALAQLWHGLSAVAVEDQAAEPVDDRQAVIRAGGLREMADGFLHQAHVEQGLFLGDGHLDVAGGGGGEGGVVLLEDRRQPAEIDDADDRLVDRIADRSGGAAPGFHAFAEVFVAMHIDRRAHEKRRPDAVGAGGILAPDAAHGQVDLPGLVQSRGVADGVEDHTLAVGQDQHRFRTRQEGADMVQRGQCRTPQLGVVMCGLVDGKTTLDHRGGELFGLHADGIGALPRLVDDRPDPLQRETGHIAIGEKAVPCLCGFTRIESGKVEPEIRARTARVLIRTHN